MNDLTKQQIRKYKLDRSRLIKGSKHYVYVHEDILIPIIMQSTINTWEELSFSCEIAHHEKSVIPIFCEFFASTNKIFILVGDLGSSLSFYEV